MTKATIIGATALGTIAVAAILVPQEREISCNKVDIDTDKLTITCKWRRDPVAVHRCLRGIEAVEGLNDEWVCKKLTGDWLVNQFDRWSDENDLPIKRR